MMISYEKIIENVKSVKNTGNCVQFKLLTLLKTKEAVGCSKCSINLVFASIQPILGLQLFL